LALALTLALTFALASALTLPLTLLSLLTEPLFARPLSLALALALLLATPGVQLLVHRVEATRGVGQLLTAPSESFAPLGLTSRLGRRVDALLSLL
jgi:hypothetical protein